MSMTTPEARWTPPSSTRERPPQDLAETVALVEKQDRRIVAREVDIRDFDALATAVREGVIELGRLDVVVANAGMTTAAPTWEIDADWRESIDVNLTGPSTRRRRPCRS
jgi:NAD(P)-dependent dehydrogenase (short-subunit alcohol dehydrogenase family)